MPLNDERAGELRPELARAYALGKMLDHSGWRGLLRNNITPSDIDIPGVPLSLDNNGQIIFGDLSISYTHWNQPNPGQRLLYEALVKHGPHCAALLKHSVTPEVGRNIDTLRDIEQFQIMVWDFEPVFSPVCPGENWQAFVIYWVNKPDGPRKIRRHILGESVGLVKPTKGLPPLEPSL